MNFFRYKEPEGGFMVPSDVSNQNIYSDGILYNKLPQMSADQSLLHPIKNAASSGSKNSSGILDDGRH